MDQKPAVPRDGAAARPDAHAPVALDVRDLSVAFPVQGRPVAVVDDVSFAVGRGEIVSVVGESGSGKSVTARSLLKMLRAPGEITDGAVLIDEGDVLRVPPARLQSIRGRRIGMVFQDPQSTLNPVMTIGAQIVEALRLHGVPRGEARRRALELLEQVGIPDAPRRFRAYPHQFSGGMKQRAVLAIALANRPDVLIADEPTTALDVTIQAQILHLLREARDTLDLAVVLITHDMGVVSEMSDRIVVMYSGRIVEEGPADRVLRHPRHPYTAALLRSMPDLRSDRRAARLPTIPGSIPDPADRGPGCAFAPRCAFAQEQCRTAVPPLEPLPGETGDRRVACVVAQERAAAGERPLAGAAPSVEEGGEARRTAETGSIGSAGEPSSAAPGALLAVEGLRVDFGTRSSPIYAVDGVSLAIERGETLGLVGESGSGKSTLGRAIMGIVPVVEGSIRVEGQEVARATAADRARVRESVQYVFQDPYASLNPRRTIRQSLAEALPASLRGARAREAALVEAMESVGLKTAHLDRYPSSFSGGQRQRIGIARALLKGPSLIILDEPVSALDVSVQAQIINLLQDLQEEKGLSYLFIAHDLSVVRHLSHRVAVMYLGDLVEVGAAAALYAAPLHPYTAALLSAAPSPRTDGPAREQIRLEGDLPSPADPPSGCRFRTRCPIGPLSNPERTICREERPRLHDVEGRQVACHFPGELAVAG